MLNMLDGSTLGSAFSSTSSKRSGGISFTCFTCPIDLEFSLDRIFNTLENVLTIMHWPQVKMMEEVRRGFLKLYKEISTPERHFSITPWFYHIYVDQKESAILMFVPKNQNLTFPIGFGKEEFEALGLPVYSFCYQ